MSWIDGSEDRMTVEEWNEQLEEIRAASVKGNTIKRVKKRKKRTGDDYILESLTKGRIMNEKYIKIFPDKTTLYYILRANIIRDRTEHDNIDVKRKYYDKGFLPCILKQSKLMELCGLSKRQVIKYISQLEKQGVIKKEQVKVDGYIYRNIFILGTWQFIGGEKNERFYLDDELE